MRNPLLRRVLLVCGLMSSLTTGVAFAQTATVAPAVQKTWPAKVEVTVGDVRTRLDGPKLWTLSGVEYKGDMMATPDSAYGLVVTMRGVGHLGTAHFLDVPGKPGQVEKELVTDLKLFLDGEPVALQPSAMDLNGKTSFRVERKSKIRAIDLESTVLLQDGVLTETQHVRTTAAIDMQKAHPTMYAWNPQATAYVLGNDKGIQSRGVFQTGSKTDVKVFKDTPWIAVFNPTTGKGSVYYVTRHPKDAEQSFILIDAPGVYRKVAMMTFVDKIVPAGFDGTFQTAVGFFEAASESEWEAAATRRAGELRASAEKAE